MDRESNRAGLEPDPRPELYHIGGSVPPEVMQRYGEWVGRNPQHPGWHLVGTLERKSLSRDGAAALFGIERAELDEVLAERAPMTAELAVRMQAAGAMPAIIWMRLQIDYDIVQARRRLVSSGVIAADAIHPDPQHQPELDPESIPVLDPSPSLRPPSRADRLTTRPGLAAGPRTRRRRARRLRRGRPVRASSARRLAGE